MTDPIKAKIKERATVTTFFILNTVQKTEYKDALQDIAAFISISH